MSSARIRPAMAVITSPPVPPSQPRDQDETLSYQSRSVSGSQTDQQDRAVRKRLSSQRVKSRPAKDAVISNIISSFDALTLPPTIGSDDYYSETGSLGSKRSRAGSDHGTIASMTGRAHSISSSGIGMDHNAGLAISNDCETDDAAPPPSIRTSRPPSGLSNYAAPSPSQSNGESGPRLRPASINSRTSSYSSLTREREGNLGYRHASESWVRQDTTSKESLQHTTPRRSQRSLRRITSQETLRPPNIAEIPLPSGTVDPQVLSRAEQIIAKTPPRAIHAEDVQYSKDSSSGEETSKKDSLVEDHSSERSPVSRTKPEDSHITQQSTSEPRITQQTSSTPKRISPRRDLIADSIPTRTSSLRQPSSSPASNTKRDKKMKRQTVAVTKTKSLSEKKSPAILESSWADLGEDDETVKRIRELREQRKSRLEESNASSLVAETPIITKELAYQNTTPHVVPSLSSTEEDEISASHARPEANRTSSEPARKAHKLLGITDDTPRPALASAKSDHASQINTRRRPSHEERTDRPAQQRPATAASLTTPPLSLDYSYAQAVNALQAIERELRSGQGAHSRGGSGTKHSRGGSGTKNHAPAQRPKSFAAPSKTEPPIEPGAEAASIVPRPKSARSKVAPENRWTAHHPDLPLDFKERKSRRKSMSDARRTRIYDDEVEIPRRDSVEDAVLNYLKAPRLSRKLRHPQTGRVIAYSEVGDPEGAAVFICVGMGLTRYVTAFYDELATTLRLRLITVDRPGVGASEPYPPGDRSGPLSWPDDILVVCQHLGINQFSLLAHSAGAIYALATALILPHLVNGKVHLLAPWIPPSQLEAASYTAASAPPAGALPRSQRLLRVLPASFLKAANSSFMTATSSSLKPASKRQISAAKLQQQRESSTSPTNGRERPATRDRPDYHRRESMMHMDQYMPTTNPLENFPIPVKELEKDLINDSLLLSATAGPMDPGFAFASTALNAAEHAEKERKIEYTSQLTMRTWELATRDSNPATDLLVCLERTRDIGFRYTDVCRQVVITHGSEDKRVPLGNVNWLADQMNSRALANMATASTGAIPQSREGWADFATSHGGCEVRILQGEGHGLMASAPIMGDVLTEIAGYYIGQGKHRTMLNT